MLRQSLFTLGLLCISTSVVQAIGICSGPDRAERKLTCLVDGDTGWENGVKWRLIGVDTPEYAAHADCEKEPEQAKAATLRLIELMRDGYTIVQSGEQDPDGRDLVRIKLADGTYAGIVLVYEGFAQPWPNSTNPWCSP